MNYRIPSNVARNLVLSGAGTWPQRRTGARSKTTAKREKKKSRRWLWQLNVFEATGYVEAHTRGEARALVKKALGLPANRKLPPSVTVRPVHQVM